MLGSYKSTIPVIDDVHSSIRRYRTKERNIFMGTLLRTISKNTRKGIFSNALDDHPHIYNATSTRAKAEHHSNTTC